MSNKTEVHAFSSARSLTSVLCNRSKPALKVAAYSVMATFVSCGVGAQDFTASPDEARGIAKEAYLYGFPVVEMYKTLYTQAIDTKSPNYKAPLNRIGNTAKAFTAKDTAFVTPNADTPYSFVWMDLRAEPQILTLPPIEEHREHHRPSPIGEQRGHGSDVGAVRFGHATTLRP